VEQFGASSQGDEQERNAVIPADSCLLGLRILAKIIARKRMRELAGKQEGKTGGASSQDELSPMAISTTILLRGKRKR